MPSPANSSVTRTTTARNNAAAPPTTTAANPSTNADKVPINPTASANSTAETRNPGVFQILRALVGLLFQIVFQVFPLWSHVREVGWTCIILLPSLLLNCYDAYRSLRGCAHQAREIFGAAIARDRGMQ